jgi:hypothetical protein
MEYDEAEHLAEINASALALAREHDAKETASAIERGDAAADIVKVALSELSIIAPGRVVPS